MEVASNGGLLAKKRPPLHHGCQLGTMGPLLAPVVFAGAAIVKDAPFHTVQFTSSLFSWSSLPNTIFTSIGCVTSLFKASWAPLACHSGDSDELSSTPDTRRNCRTCRQTYLALALPSCPMPFLLLFNLPDRGGRCSLVAPEALVTKDGACGRARTRAACHHTLNCRC